MPLHIADIKQDEIASLYRKPLVLVRPDGHVAWRDDVLPNNVAELLNRVRGASDRRPLPASETQPKQMDHKGLQPAN
jgi:hypothetical protein